MSKEQKIDKQRNSSKKMVALAREVIEETQTMADAIEAGHNPDISTIDKDGEALKWLVLSARSMAGSIFSQADPND